MIGNGEVIDSQWEEERREAGREEEERGWEKERE